MHSKIELSLILGRFIPPFQDKVQLLLDQFLETIIWKHYFLAFAPLFILPLRELFLFIPSPPKVSGSCVTLPYLLEKRLINNLKFLF